MAFECQQNESKTKDSSIVTVRSSCGCYSVPMLRDAPIKTGATFEEYVAFETTSDVRHEFIDGNLFRMAGGTRRHNFLTNRLTMKLFDVALQKNCVVYSSDVIVRLPSGKGFYPDVFVTCDSSMDSAQVVQRPCIIIEVLSTSTEIFDRREKWEQYQQLPTLEQYILLSQSEPVAEVYSRRGEQWLYERVTGDAALRFPLLELQFALSEIYAGASAVSFDETD